MTFDAQDLVKQAIERHGDHIAVACSFGKDSMVILHMALKINPNIKVIFEYTGVQFPETIKFKEEMKNDWNIDLYETKILKSFWQCEKEYGLPGKRKGGGKGSNAPKCCYYLKEKPAMILQKELKVNAIITGLQACESSSRKLLALRYDNNKARYMSKDGIEFCSQRWFTKHTSTWNYHPIMLWSNEDVWNYTFKNDIPINPVYWKWDVNGKIYEEIPNLSVNKKDGLLLNGVPALYQRSGCLPCTAYLDWEKKLSVSHPHLYRTLKKKEDPTQKMLKPT